MQLATKYFGTIDYEAEDVLSFPDGLFGFEEERAFLLLPFEGSEGNLLCLQSVQTPPLAFVAMNPFSLKGDYAPVLREEELRLMGAEIRFSRRRNTYYFGNNFVLHATVEARIDADVLDKPHEKEDDIYNYNKH